MRHVRIRNMALLGEAHLLAGDRARGLAVAAHALELAQVDGTPLNIGLAQRALGRIRLAGGELEAAEGHLADAMQTFTRCQAMFEVARTRVDLGTLEAARGNTLLAREHFSVAVTRFEAAKTPERASAARERARSQGIDLLR
jgi:hypothetical protein